MISGDGLSWSYGAERVLADVAISTPPGRVLGLVGPNGSGKTTLLRLLHGSLRSPTGEVRLDGDPLSRLGVRQVARRVAVVVQEQGTESMLTAGEIVLLGRSPHLSRFGSPGPDDDALAADCLHRVGGAHLGGRPFAELSGGERQRVLIARALAQQATHLLLDEPTNHLDIRYQHEILQRVRELGTTVIVVLHDLNLAARYCDDLVLLDAGRPVARGPVDQVLRPDVLEPVYGIGIRRVEVGGRLHLLFDPDAVRVGDQPMSPAAEKARE